ncbi:MAG: glycerol-3-phosphate 1-O-acyltransferase PlsY [Oscillospiraceae bacterium]|nr:glycerol-3-phosphate 1-O-acyltransferase PlsY [Oscillospiraceae bacterium]
MKEFIIYLIIIIVSYLLGSVSSSILVSKALFKLDIRKYGSGNAGATDVARVFGITSGLLTLAGDLLKTVISMMIGMWLMGDSGEAIAGLACIIGHCWPVLFKFEGGKGVAVGCAIALMMDWRVCILLVLIFAVVVMITRTVSIASLTATFTFPPLLILFGERDPLTIALSVIVVIIIYVQHRGNIARIIAHKEPKFELKKKKDS